MTSPKNIFDISGRAMAAQMVRLNTIASNIANVGGLAGSEDEAYRPLRPVFETEYADSLRQSGVSSARVVNVVELNKKPERLHMPEHPSADEAGYVYSAAVNIEQEYVDMLEASRQYQNNIEVVTTMRKLMMRTINMGR